jgi:hypothetical protein
MAEVVRYGPRDGTRPCARAARPRRRLRIAQPLLLWGLLSGCATARPRGEGRTATLELRVARQAQRDPVTAHQPLVGTIPSIRAGLDAAGGPWLTTLRVEYASGTLVAATAPTSGSLEQSLAQAAVQATLARRRALSLDYRLGLGVSIHAQARLQTTRVWTPALAGSGPTAWPERYAGALIGVGPAAVGAVALAPRRTLRHRTELLLAAWRYRPYAGDITIAPRDIARDIAGPRAFAALDHETALTQRVGATEVGLVHWIRAQHEKHDGRASRWLVHGAAMRLTLPLP